MARIPTRIPIIGRTLLCFPVNSGEIVEIPLPLHPEEYSVREDPIVSGRWEVVTSDAEETVYRGPGPVSVALV